MKIRVLLIAITLILTACAPHSAPVINKSPFRKIPLEYVVRKGDALYSIAWSVGLDYQDIAKWNRIRPPYVIQPGQRLRLRPPTAKATPPNTASNTRISVVQKPSSGVPTQTTQPKTNHSSRIAHKPAVKSGKAPGAWKWPAKGELVGKYRPAKGVNGIQISGQNGSPVTAAASGQVVYVGEGLRGYGKLVILKHSATFLSAYAHNKAILVSEGDNIKSGQQIAQMGNSGASSTMLHFEIRKDGKPVDPLQYLN